jgi:hypothetical protein
MQLLSACALCGCAVLAGCGGKPPPPADAGRAESRPLEAAGAAGYDGAALRQQVDRMLDERDRQQRERAAAAP